MSPLLRKVLLIGAGAVALLVAFMLALAALKAAWAALRLFVFFALIAAFAFVVWRGWRKWKNRGVAPRALDAPPPAKGSGKVFSWFQKND